MTRLALALVAPDHGPVTPPDEAGHGRGIDAAELALDMISRAFEALALLYEIRHPGEYAAQARRLKEYVADNFRHVERTLAGEGLDPDTFRDAVLRVRDVFERVDQQVAEMPQAHAARAA